MRGTRLNTGFPRILTVKDGNIVNFVINQHQILLTKFPTFKMFIAIFNQNLLRTVQHLL